MLAASGSLLDPRARGCNDLIRQGAAVCDGAEDVLRAMETIRGFRSPPAFTVGDKEPSPKLLQAHLRTASPRPVHIDELARLLTAPPGTVFAALVNCRGVGGAGAGIDGAAGLEGRR